MRTLVIVKLEVVLQTLVGLIEGVISLRIHLLIFDRSPQPFDKDIVMGPSTPIHADPDSRLRQAPREREAGKLRSLIGVEDGPLAVRQGILQAVQAKARLQGGDSRHAKTLRLYQSRTATR